MTEVRIGDLRANDLPAALELNNANVPALSELDLGGLTRLIGLANNALAARPPARDDLVGFCLTFAPGVDYQSMNYRWFSERYEDFVYLDRIVVHPDHRGLGIGAAFYEELELRLAGSAPWLFCEVNIRPMNEGSLRFHHRVGFIEVGQQDTDNGHKTVSMLAKRLAQ